MERHRISKTSIGFIQSYQVNSKPAGSSSSSNMLVRRAISNNINNNYHSKSSNNNIQTSSKNNITSNNLSSGSSTTTSLSVISPKEKAKNFVSTQSNGYGSYSSVFSSASYGAIYSKVSHSKK